MDSYCEVIKWGEGNEKSLPAEWPRDCHNLGKFETPPSSTLGGIIMTEAELDAHIESYQDDYDVWRVADNLRKAKRDRCLKVDEKTKQVLLDAFVALEDDAGSIIFGTIMSGKVKGIVQTSKAKKVEINAAANLPALDIIEDNR